MRPSPRALLLVVASTAATSCIVSSRSVDEVPVAPQRVESTLRVFMSDGSVVVFEDGATIDDRWVAGGRPSPRWNLTRSRSEPVTRVPLDSVVGIESFGQETRPGVSLLATLGATALVVAGGVAIACAADPKCFGSCPTVYSYDEDGELLEAEAFSYSISPLLEARDVDRLAVQADEDGRVELEIRNEALETHFINHLELLEVRHPRGSRVVPDPGNRPLVVGPLRAVGPVVDREGRDVTARVSTRDGDAFSSSAARTEAVTPEDDRDWLELTLPPADADSVAVLLRLRNSLLSTILFYDFMLARQGAGALDWMARDVERIGTAVELGRWFNRTMGLRLEVEREGGFREVARLGDTGPIAWSEVGFVVPVEPGEPTRLRFSFLADEWRIDHLAWSDEVSRADARAHGPTAVLPLEARPEDGPSPDDLALLRDADESYFVTTAGAAFLLRFETGVAEPGTERTFLLSSQGYYTEWIRPDWIRNARNPERFRPRETLLPELMARWREVKGPMEAAFHDTRIPVR